MTDLMEIQRVERVAARFLEPDAGRKVDQKILNMVALTMLPWIKGPEVLDLGPGDVEWAPHVIEKFGRYSAVDASVKILDKVKAIYGDQVTLYNSLFEQFTPPIQYDSIIAAHVLEHVKDPVALLRDAATWLKKDGHIFLVEPNATSLHRRLGVCMGLTGSVDEFSPEDELMGHRRVYSAETLEGDIAASGLRIVNRRGLFVKFLPQGMMTGFSDGLLEGYMKLSDEMPMEFCNRLAYECALG